MNMPGFTAEASLHRTSDSYHLAGTVNQVDGAIYLATAFSCNPFCLSSCNDDCLSQCGVVHGDVVFIDRRCFIACSVGCIGKCCDLTLPRPMPL